MQTAERRTPNAECRTPNADRGMQNAERRTPNAERWSAEYHAKHVLAHSFTECHRITDPVHNITDKKLALKETIVINNNMSKNNKQTAVSYKRNETTHVVKTFIYELDVSYAPTYIFRSNGYQNYSHLILWSHGHFDILATGQSDIHCKIKETLLIRDLKPALNENVGSEKLLLY